MSSRDLTRRRFLQVSMAAAPLALVPRLARGQAPGAPSNVKMLASAPSVGGKTLLQPSDFSFVGAFALPCNTPAGADCSFGMGMTHRYVNGQLRLILGAWKPQNVYEVTMPALKTAAPFNQATVLKEWGDVTSGKRYTPSGSNTLLGLYWDSVDSRLYWNYGDLYNMTTNTDPCVGYSTLNDSTGSATAVGCWSFANRGQKLAMGGCCAIPAWFANQYTSGRRLGAGFGGYFSGVQNDSLGPSLTAFAPPGSGTADRSALANTVLVGYPADATNVGVAYSTPDRCHRDTNYYGDGSNWITWPAKNGVGYWTACDYLGQGGTWIDTPTKTGMLYFPFLSIGHCWYNTNGMYLSADGAYHWWYMYDPTDLANVVQGKKQQWEIQPAWQYRSDYPNIKYPLPSWVGVYPSQIMGVSFDSTTNRLYVAVQFATTGCAYGSALVYVYQVAG